MKQELETARSQGFDPVEKGLVIVVKKNGRVLRRLTGQPPWSSLVGTMEVADGSSSACPATTSDARQGVEGGWRALWRLRS